MVVYGNQLTAFYMELIQGNEPELGDDCSYIQYIADENAYELSDRYQKDKAYWLDKFSDLPELTGWKSYNPLSLSTHAVREHFTVPEVLYHELQAFCQQNRISLFQFFMGAMYIYIHKMTNQPDVVIGTSFANRGTKKRSKDRYVRQHRCCQNIRQKGYRCVELPAGCSQRSDVSPAASEISIQSVNSGS